MYVTSLLFRIVKNVLDNVIVIYSCRNEIVAPMYVQTCYFMTVEIDISRFTFK